MTIYGYARVSSTGQDLTIQREALKKAGCEVIRQEKKPGTSRKGRTELKTLMDFMTKGDMLVVTRIDRLARSIRDLQNIVHELNNRDITLKATEQPIHTKTAAGKALTDMLAVFAECETNLRRERQMEEIAEAKKAGVYKGRKATIDRVEVGKLQEEGLGATEIASQLEIARSSVYRLLNV